MRLVPGDKIRDIGYGNGFFLHIVYRKCKVDMYGSDISEDMKEQAEKKNRLARNNGQLFLQVGDCCH